MAILVFLLVGCTSTDQTISPTKPLIPTANLTPRPIPDLNFDLDQIKEIMTSLIRYVSGVTGSDFIDTPPPWLSPMPAAQFVVNQRLSAGSGYGGNVIIFIYPDPADLRLGYDQAQQTVFTPRQIDTVGEIAVIDHNDLVFIRCYGVVSIRLARGDPDLVEAYARVLDAKLLPLLCPETFIP